MNNSKNTIIALVLIAVVFIVSNQLLWKEEEQPAKKNKPKQAKEKTKLPNKNQDSSRAGALVFKSRKKPTKLIIIVVVVVYCVIVGAFYLGLRQYKSSLLKQTEKKREQIKEYQQTERSAQFRELMRFREKSTIAKRLLKDHRYWTPIFTNLLEKNTLPNVQYTRFTGTYENRSVNLELLANSFRTIARQILIFQESSQVVEVEPKSPRKTQEGVRISIKLTVSPDLWQKNITLEK